MLRRLAVVFIGLIVSACTRDLGLPGPPAPGTIQGRVVYAVPQTTEKKAAAGASVTVLGTSLGAIAGADGRFLVQGISSGQGSLLIQADLDGDGKPDRQLLLAFTDIHAGLGHDVALGDVSIVENGSIHGRVLRADVPSTTEGQRGTVVFVPQGPYTTYTGDDGSFRLDNLPAGTLSLTFFRDGYDPKGHDPITLRPGEDFQLTDVTLNATNAAPQPGTIAGQLTLLPPVADASAATVTAFPIAGDPLVARATASGAFSLTSVPPGLYRVEVTFTGYTRAVAANIFVGAGQQIALAISLAKDGITVSPPPPPPSTACVGGARCDLPNPCQVGAVNCATGSPICASIGNALDGIPCGANQVCSAGACIPVCIGGASCRPPSDPCKQGTVACTGGVPVCAAGTDTMPDGTACGQDKVCHAGSCVGCVSGAVCNSANPCHSGLTDCSTGVQVCKDSGQSLSDGTPCGSNLYCNAGACGACTPGISCDPAGFPCHTGATSCATGRPVCTDLGGAKTNGTSCGQNQVCFAGACNACTQGQSCTPSSNACHDGSIACATGQPVCVDQQTNRGPGVSCGAGHVCDGVGDCIACGQGASCTPANPCHVGAIDCSTGAPVCADLGGNLTDGTSCGSGKVCFGGNCNACSAGSLCTPSNACHVGTLACDTGLPVCGDSGTSLGDGASCGTNQVCFHGTCGPCTVGQSCTVGTPDPCKVYGIACSTGQPVCGVAGNQPDGTSCGSGMICRSGSCQTSPLRIVVVSGGGQDALPNQPLTNPVVIQIADLGGAGRSGQTVSIAPPPGAQANPASATTDANGNASFTLALGRAVGVQTFTVNAPAAYPTSAAFTETADALTDGTVIPLVNTSHTAGNSPLGGPGPSTQPNYMGGIAVASNGDIYFADDHNCRVNKLTPAGVVLPIAGLPPSQTSCGFSGDTGLATNAQLYFPSGLALDEANGRLYVAEYGNNRVRVIDLARGLIDTFAGTTDPSVADVPPYGDGGTARSARIDNPDWIALGPERPNPALYVTDLGHKLLRRIDGNDGTISTVVRSDTSCTAPVGLYDFYSPNYGSGLAFDGEGHLFFAGRLCGTQTGTTGIINGIARVRPDGSLALVAGSPSGGLGGGSALGAGFYEPPLIAFDNAKDTSGALKNNLYFTVPGSHVVGRIDGASGQLRVIGGTVGTGVAAGDFGPATSARFNYPQALAFAPNGRDLVVGEFYDGSIRMIANAGSTAAGTASLAVSGSNVRSSYVDQIATPPLQVTLQDGSGALLAGYPVAFSLDPSGLPGGWVSNAVAQTSLAGIAPVTARPGLAVGRYGVLASFNDIHGDPVTGSPVSFTIDAVAPTGLVFTAVNDAHIYGTSATTQSGPGTTLTITNPHAVTAASDGTLYLSDNNWTIYRIDPSGYMTRIAGNGGSYSGDGGPALIAGMVPWGLALDEVAKQLYFADQTGNRIRVIDLVSRAVSTYAGSGATPVAPYGDGGPAASATFTYPTRIAIANGYLYASDYTDTTSIRRIKIDSTPANRIVNTMLARGMTQAFGTPSAVCSDAPTFWYCYSDPGCQVTAEPGAPGRLYVAAWFCGLDFNNNGANSGTVPGIVRIEADNSLTRIAGHVLNGLTGGTAAGNVGFPTSYPPMIRFDPTGNLWIATGSQVGYFPPAIGPDGKLDVNVNSVFTQVGNGPPASIQPGQYDPVSNAFFPAPVDLGFLNGSGGTHVVVADNYGGSPTYYSYSVRIIW